MSKGQMLDGKVIIVTGAGGGVGEGIARLAADQGAKVIVNDLGGNPDGEGGASAGPAERVASEIREAGGDATANTQSVATWDSAHEIVQFAIDTYGRLDAVVNNAGVLRDVIFHKMTEQDWDIVRSVNLDGVFYMARAAAPVFKAQASGSFVHMTSTSGLIGNMGQANYIAAKLGVAGLSKSIAIDMKRFNVNSNCIAPFAFTRMVGTIPSNTEENRKRLEVAKRMTPEKIAPMAVALMSEAAKDVTGQIFGARMNEMILFSQNRPVRTAQKDDGWTPEMVAEKVLPAFKGSFTPLEISSQVVNWDP